MDLNRLRLLVAVADTGSFTAAAERMGTTKAMVSQQIKRLESDLGVTLLSRTTRRVSLTEPGAELVEECAPLLRQTEEAVARVARNRDQLRGTLRITAPVDFASEVVAPVVAAFSRQHPDMQIELIATDEVIDMVAGGINLALRMGWLKDSTLRATQLGRFEQWIIASPAYAAQIGPLTRPEQLAHCRWVALSLLRTPLSWSFEAADGERVDVRMRAPLRTDSPLAMTALVRHGAGVSAMADLSAQKAVAAGELVRLLHDWHLPAGGIYAVHPPGRHIPEKVRAFIDAFRHHLSNTAQGNVMV
ncbi:MAG: LysR substrate-binding domain-containing protein [Rhodocyclaceae bacterium]